MTATASARANRRRRLLQDGVTPAPSTESLATTEDDGAPVRYTPREGSASFAVAASVLPRSIGALLATGAALVAVAAALGWADGIAEGVAGGAFADVLGLGVAGSLSAWWETALWIAVVAQAGILFGLRRQRTDDVSGGYRWWLVVAFTASLMSLQSATQVHSQIAIELANLTGFSPLPGAAFWWLVPGALLLGGVTVRTLLETRESAAATVVGVSAVVVNLIGWLFGAAIIPLSVVGSLTWINPTAIAPLASLLAASLALMTLVLYSRRIVMEVEGAVAPPSKARRSDADDDFDAPLTEAEPAKATPVAKRAPTPKPVGTKPAGTKPAGTKPRIVAAPVEEEEPVTPPRRARRAAKPAVVEPEAPADTQWVSGGESYDDDYGDDGAPKRRKLSKAERKRLRREKARRAA